MNGIVEVQLDQGGRQTERKIHDPMWHPQDELIDWLGDAVNRTHDPVLAITVSHASGRSTVYSSTPWPEEPDEDEYDHRYDEDDRSEHDVGPLTEGVVVDELAEVTPETLQKLEQCPPKWSSLRRPYPPTNRRHP